VKSYGELDTRITEAEVSTAELIDRCNKLKRIIRLTGLSEKSITEIMKIDDDFLENYPWTVHTDSDVRFLFHNNRVVQLKSDLDMNTLRMYEKIWKMNRDDMKGYLLFYREIAPHLDSYFNLIERGVEVAPAQVINTLLQHYYTN
jgi:hypothetical protein